MPAVLVALPVVLIVVLLALCAFGIAIILAPLFVRFLNAIPIVGPSVGGQVLDFTLNWQQHLTDWLNQSADPLVAAIFVPINALQNWVNSALTWAGAVTNTLAALAQSVGGDAGNLVGRIAQLATHLAAVALAQVNLAGTVGDIISQLQTLFSTTLPNLATTVLDAAKAALHVAITAEVGLRNAAIAVAVQQVEGLVGDAEAAAQAGLTDLAHALTHTAAQLAAQIVAVESGTIDYVDGLVKPLGIELDALRDVAIPTALTIALTATKTVATELEQLNRDCISPTCSAISPSLNVLNALAAGVELALLLEMLTTAIRDPQAAGRELGQAGSELTSLVRPVVAILGIRV